MTGPLDGLKVIELAGMGPVPFTGMMLADMGADVLRIERPPIRTARSLVATESLNPESDVVKRGRDAVAVDLKHQDGLSLVLDLCERADVIIEGFRPGVVERLGLGPDTVRARNKRIVYARLTGYGQSGPWALQAGHDINYVAMSGVLDGIRRVGERPLPPVNLLADFAGGGMFAAFGIAAALFEASRSGEGQTIDVAMVEGVGTLAAKLHSLRSLPEWSDTPGTNFLDSGAPFYETYRTLDNRFVAVGALEPDFYDTMLSRLEVDTSSWPDQYDRRSWPRLRELLAMTFSSKTMAEWENRFEGTDACVTPVLTFEEAADHRQAVHRRTYLDPGGQLQPAPTPRFSRSSTALSDRPRGVARDPGAVLSRWGVTLDMAAVLEERKALWRGGVACD